MVRRLAIQGAILLGIIALIVLVVKPLLEHPHSVVPGVILHDLHAVADLQTRFNQDIGQPRLILLLSPTWSVCLAGARWVQQDLLAPHPAARMQVYTVWFSMLPGDSRESWDPSVLPDRRVTHLWDAEQLVGHWFAAHAGDALRIAWDGY